MITSKRKENARTLKAFPRGKRYLNVLLIMLIYSSTSWLSTTDTVRAEDEDPAAPVAGQEDNEAHVEPTCQELLSGCQACVELENDDAKYLSCDSCSPGLYLHSHEEMGVAEFAVPITEAMTTKCAAEAAGEGGVGGRRLEGEDTEPENLNLDKDCKDGAPVQKHRHKAILKRFNICIRDCRLYDVALFPDEVNK